MNKVALGWADAGIKTVDQAKDDAAAHSQIYYSVMKALGITRAAIWLALRCHSSTNGSANTVSI